MKLITKQLLEDFNKVGKQDGDDNPTVVAKFFNPQGAGTWYATEIDSFRLEKDGEVKVVDTFEELEALIKDKWVMTDICFFGLADILERELGYFMLSELVAFKGRLGMPIERDMYFEQRPLKEVLRDED